jgi:hypothetical protein
MKGPGTQLFQHGFPPAALLALAALFFGLAVLLVIVFPSWWQGLIAASVVGILPGLFFLRMSRVGAHLTPDGVKLVRTFRTLKFGWDEVVRFVIRPRGLQPLAVFLELRDGRFEWVEGVGPWYRFSRLSPELEVVVGRMNHALDAQSRAT